MASKAAAPRTNPARRWENRVEDRDWVTPLRQRGEAQGYRKGTSLQLAPRAASARRLAGRGTKQSFDDKGVDSLSPDSSPVKGLVHLAPLPAGSIPKQRLGTREGNYWAARSER